MDDLPEVLRTKLSLDPETGCWVWIAARDKRGYGRVRWEGKTVFPYRVILQLRGQNLDGLDVDHLCRNPACCNPEHLEAVSHRENLRRGVGGPLSSARYAEHLHCPAGHPLFGPNLYLATTPQGHKNKQCRTCRAAANRRVTARRKAARLAAQAPGG